MLHVPGPDGCFITIASPGQHTGPTPPTRTWAQCRCLSDLRREPGTARGVLKQSVSAQGRACGVLITAWTRVGQVATSVAVDRCSAQFEGIHAARQATRIEAFTTTRQSAQNASATLLRASTVVCGLSVRHDRGSCRCTAPSSRNRRSWASRARPPSCVSRRATAAPSASSARSERSYSAAAASR